jgi:hypothetical protein
MSRATQLVAMCVAIGLLACKGVTDGGTNDNPLGIVTQADAQQAYDLLDHAIGTVAAQVDTGFASPLVLASGAVTVTGTKSASRGQLTPGDSFYQSSSDLTYALTNFSSGGITLNGTVHVIFNSYTETFCGSRCGTSGSIQASGLGVLFDNGTRMVSDHVGLTGSNHQFIWYVTLTNSVGAQFTVSP